MPDLEKEFVLYVVRTLVAAPDDVSVERSSDERGELLLLTVHPDDMGKVIGRAGATAKSLRTLLRVMSMQHGTPVRLKIVEPDGTTLAEPSEGRAPITPAADRYAQDKQEIAELTDLEL